MTPQTDLPSLPPPPDPGSSARPRRPRRGLVAGAVAMVVALVAGAAAFALTQSGRSAEARPLTLRFTEGQTETYAIHQTVDGSISSEQFGELPIELDVSQVMTWTVVSVDEDGTATVEIATSEVSGRVNGIDVPATGTPMPLEFVVAPDGRIVSAGGLALGGAGQTDGLGFPGMGQLTPVLPEGGEPVAPGDTWEREFVQDFPFGDGTIEYSAVSTYERNETVDGRQGAVIATEMPVEAAFTLEFDELIEAIGEDLGASGATGADLLADASVAYAGRGRVTQTSVVDLDARELLRTEGEGDFRMSIEFAGVPGFDGAMEFSGTFTQSLERR